MQNTSDYLSFAQKTLDVDFNDISILITAFTHRSYLNEHKKTVKEHNERLEFLGDAVLELIVTEYLYKQYQNPEGTLTNWRSSLVRTESIGQAASRLGFEPFLRLSRGEKRGTQRARDQILANCYEAVIGAIYLDQGYDEAKKFVSNSLIVTFQDILATGSWQDPKSTLQELAQNTQGVTPVYKVLSAEGPDHDKSFKVGVYIKGIMRGEGVGPSKQAGQVAAATNALKDHQAFNGASKKSA